MATPGAAQTRRMFASRLFVRGDVRRRSGPRRTITATAAAVGSALFEAALPPLPPGDAARAALLRWAWGMRPPPQACGPWSGHGRSGHRRSRLTRGPAAGASWPGARRRFDWWEDPDLLASIAALAEGGVKRCEAGRGRWRRRAEGGRSQSRQGVARGEAESGGAARAADEGRCRAASSDARACLIRAWWRALAGGGPGARLGARVRRGGVCGRGGGNLRNLQRLLGWRKMRTGADACGPRSDAGVAS